VRRPDPFHRLAEIQVNLIAHHQDEPWLLVPHELLEFLDANTVGGKQLHVGEHHLALVLSRENLHQEKRLRADMKARFGDRVRLVDSHGAVSVVGAGINATFENVRRGGAALSAEHIAVEGVATSSFRITWLIDRARLDDAVRLLHKTFIESHQSLLP